MKENCKENSNRIDKRVKKVELEDEVSEIVYILNNGGEYVNRCKERFLEEKVAVFPKPKSLER